MKSKLLLIALVFSFWPLRPAQAEGLQWSLPGGIGTVQIPSTTSDVLPLVGYDAIQKEVIAGASASLLTLWKEINGYAGAVGAFQTKGPYLQPYLAIGSDFARYVPALRQVQNLEIHAFVRYVPSPEGNNHLGAGGSLSYKFGPASAVVPQAPSQPPAPAGESKPIIGQ